ncbi:MAG: pyrroline-5-carboxylate reductase [Clostridiaceae bacterium]|nr:pyrroline-5-carboxylate reductase [Clostridiaceae bacterium]
MILAVIGTGNMGQALVSGFIRQALIRPDDLRLFDPDQAKLTKFAESLGARACGTADDAVSEADLVLLAVKPQVIEPAVNAFAGNLKEGVLILSIAAGVSLARLRSLAGSGTALARIMPNTPAMVGSGVSAVCFDQASKDQQELTRRLLESCGLVFILPEKQMDAVTGLSGSGPAYVMLMIEAMADAGVKLGLPRDIALKMAAMTLMGSARMVLETGMHPAVLKDQVCSPGGTTIDAVARLEKNGLRAALIDAVCTAADKSRQMREQAGDHG